jgi:hypothetical protein
MPGSGSAPVLRPSPIKPAPIYETPPYRPGPRRLFFQEGEGFRSFDAFKRVYGPAGPGREWHQIVEQTDANVGRFGPQRIHNTDNMVNIGELQHRRISGHYSSKQPFTGGQTVREWLRSQSFQQQTEYGQRIIRQTTVRPP